MATFLAMPTVVVSLALAGTETWRLLHPRSTLFAAPQTYSLADALEQHQLDQAYAFARRLDPRAMIPVRHPIITNGRTVLATPLMWAAAVRDREGLLMLMQNVDAHTDQGDAARAICVAQAAGISETARVLRMNWTVSADQCFRLTPGQPLMSFLGPGGFLLSPNGRYRLIYQEDGNLVLYDQQTGAALWASGTEGTSAGYTVLHPNGDLTVHDAAGAERWATRTAGHPDAVLVLQDEGNVALRDSRGQELWRCCP